MGGLDMDYGRPPLPPKGPLAVSKKDMEHIRRVFDQDMSSKKLNSIISPREDAQMFRSLDRHAVPCEGIVELYELLWRWGHRTTDQPGFAKNFGFAIPDTIIIEKGKPYAWYFVSKKDGSLLRKSEGSLTLGAVEKKFCRDRKDDESPICAAWYPVASQFSEARCHSPMAEFMTPGSCREFLSSLRCTHSGIIQAFVEPCGVSNFLVRTVQYKNQTSLSVRTNRALLVNGKGNAFDKCATFEGWEGLSSSCSRYRSVGQQHMEDLILEAGEALNQRIELECVRHMLFLEPTQHVALHFKVTKDQMLYFIYASVVSEKDVILQTRPQLLMRDSCMTEDLPCQALLPGGTEKKATPYEAPACAKRLQDRQREAQAALDDMRNLLESESSERSRREGSLPPIHGLSQATDRALSDVGSSGRRRRSMSARGPSKFDSILPKVHYARPAVPSVPYQIHSLQHSLQESGRYEYSPPFLGQDVVKRPLVTPASARTEPPGSLRPPQGSLSARSEPGGLAALSTSR
mmetsp:Transcript_43457/g.139678  ORF Transcript_43457/g.139678 Transcript_43457/m.139678 type:complete len:518 (+) Transcript_43457:151-1704(+)